MNRFVIGGIAILLILVFVLVLFTFLPTYTIITDDISAEGRELIAKQKTTDSKWSNIVTSQDNSSAVLMSETRVETMFENECFSLTSPIALRTVNANDGCNARISTSNPSGKILLARDTLTSSLDEHSAIKLRRSKSEKYSESRQSYNDVDYIIFEKNDTYKFQQSGFANIEGYLVAITLEVPGGNRSSYQADFISILSNTNFEF